MSKFCGVISSQAVERPQFIETPITFQYLEMLADWLNNETEQLQGEFLTKCQFQQEQQNQIVENEQNLRDLHENLLALVQAIEVEEQQSAAGLETLECGINALERITAREEKLQRGAEANDRPHRLHVLDLLERTDNVMLCLGTLMAELGECEQTTQQQINPYNLICGILDFHVRTLVQTDKNLDTLQDRATAIDESIRQLMEKITAAASKISHGTHTCTCAPNKNVYKW